MNIVEQAKQQGLTKFDYRISADDRPHSYEFNMTSQDKAIADVFEQELQKIERHPADSDEFVHAVQSFVNEVMD